MSDMTASVRVAVLISGTGSNLKTLIDAVSHGMLNIEICGVISNRAEAPGLDHAREADVPYLVVNAASAVPGQDEDEAVAVALHAMQPDLVLLSGYMRVLGSGLVSQFAGRMINQHPSLLPKFKGLHTYQKVLEAGDTEHGASVHFVTAELDDGPVIAQVRVDVEPADTEQSLATRLGPAEHRLLVSVMELFAARRVRMHQGAVWLDGAPLARPLEFTDEALVA